jgi:hypothetical protein
VLSRVVVKKRRGRRLFTGLAVASIIAGTFITAGTVFAVHELDFQLDGNTAASCPPAPDTGFCTASQKDWNDLFNVATAAGTQTVSSNTPITGASGSFTTSTFSRDFRTGTSTTCKTAGALSSAANTFCTFDSTTFATGSKDTLEINTGWACNADNNVNSKIDIMNAYSASYTRTSDGHKILYFGLDKNKDNGTNDAGFWFLQGDASCDAPAGTHPNFTGTHRLGDVLVVAEYSRGGGVGNITAYRWDGVTPLVQIATAGPGLADCKTKAANDALCGTTNSGAKQFNGNITTPWLTSDATLGVGNTVVPPDFFEGGIDITAAFASSGGTTAPSCFNTYIADTRSSTSLTATLFDFARGRLGECTATMTTQPSQTTRLISSTDPITDTATVVGHSGGGTGTTPTGTVSFFLCAPDELTPANTGTCQASDGSAVTGNPVALVETVPGTSAATSGDAQSLIAGIGKYCFRAAFTGTGDYAGQTGGVDNAADECFTVTGQASLSTAQDWLPNDSATITGPTALSGTATFTLYHDLTCGNDGGAVVYGPVGVSVSGSSPQTVGTLNTTKVVQATDGNYSWKVTYADAVLGAPSASCETTSIDITN